MKKILAAAGIAVSFLFTQGLCQSLKEADALFEKGTFQEAHKVYSEVFEKSDDIQTKWPAFYRAVECLAHLYKYGEAAQKITYIDIPEDTSFRIRLLFLKAEILKNFARQYRPIQPEDITENGEKKDIFRYTKDEISNLVNDIYIELFEYKDILAGIELKNESYFFDIKNSDLDIYPTMFDYLVLHWSNSILSSGNSGIKELKHEEIIAPDFDKPLNLKDLPVMIAAQLYHFAANFKTEQRQQAAEFNRVDRVLLGQRFEYSNNEFRNKEVEILLAHMREFKNRASKAYAGYNAALLYRRLGEPAKAVELCKTLQSYFPAPIHSKFASRLRKELEMPLLNISKLKIACPAETQICEINTTNIKKVFFRIYIVNPEQVIEDLNQKHKHRYGYSNSLAYRDSEWLKDFFAKYRPFRSFDADIEKYEDYKNKTTPVELPQLKENIYLLAVSDSKNFNIGSSLIKHTFINITNLSSLVSSGITVNSKKAYFAHIEDNAPPTVNDEIFRIYCLDSKTGAPIKDANIKYSLNGIPETTSILSDKNGTAKIQKEINNSPRSYHNFRLDLLAKDGSSSAYLENEAYLYYRPETPIRVFIQTDRPIYRPGDKVELKAVATCAVSTGFKTMGGKNLKVKAYDTNHKEFFSQELTLSEYGSASSSFTIPTGRLLGRYTISADYSDGRFSGSSSSYFSVEEYKRPEFEVVLDKAQTEWRYEKEVAIKGSVKYYFGGAVPNAPVKYVIKRQRYVPWYFSFWFPSNYGTTEILSGSTKTDEKGVFSINFTPTPESSVSKYLPDITRFIVEAESRDAGGRSITGSQTYMAGKNAFYFTVKESKGFFFTNEQPEFTISMLTVNDSPLSGRGGYEIHALESVEPEKPEGSFSKHSTQPLDIQLEKVPNAEKMADGKLNFGKDGKAKLRTARLPAGTYRLSAAGVDKWGGEVKQDKIFVVSQGKNEAVPLKALNVTLAEKEEYAVGEEANIMIGSCLAGGIYFAEIWSGEYLADTLLFETKKPVQIITIPITNELKGGFSLRWFGISSCIIYSGDINIPVPFSEKKLNVKINNLDEKIKPGERYTWSMSVKDHRNYAQQSESLVLMYDRSLEYYIKSQNPFMESLYTQKISNISHRSSMFLPRISGVEVTKGLIAQILQSFRESIREPQKPGIRTHRTWAGRGGLKEFKGLVRTAVSPDSVFLSEERAELNFEMKLDAASAVAPGGGAEEPQVQARKAFADTAFFKPHIVSSKYGRAEFTFTAPEQLTSWRIKAFSFTKDVKYGTLDAQTATHKDLMARVDIPRFFREKDRGTITAIIHNESDKPLKGTANIQVSLDGYILNDKIKLKESRRNFNIRPHSQASFDWNVEIPSGVGTYKVKVTALSGKLIDAEERDLPILPSRERLIESRITALSGDEKQTLQINLKSDPTRINESMVLQIEPQLFLSILNSIPFLIEYPYSTVDQTLNKFVPLSIMNKMYENFPELKKSTAKIPKRTTVTPPWDKDDPQRLLELMETPWIWQSEGRPAGWPIIDMLNPELVKSQEESKLEILKSAQNSDGGFPWFPGGRSDPYITLYVLAGFSEAINFGVDIPADMINRALRYCSNEIPKRLKPEPYDLALVSYASYVLTSYPASKYSGAKPAHEAAKSWVVYLDKNIHVLTALGKAYLAYTYLRLGDKTKASDTLDMAMDGFQEDPVAGVYWTPEKYSWVWYSDTIEKHAFIIRTLTALRPEDKRIKGLVQWLLFNRKGNVWKSTKASAAAIYALIDYMNKTGALTADEIFNIEWGKNKDSIIVKADDWFAKPIRLHKTGFDITPDLNQAVIEKKGPGFAFASLTWTYSTDQLPEASEIGMLSLDRKIYLREKDNDSYRLKLLKSNDTVKVGNQIEVHLKINTRSQFEYMHLKDTKASGFEAETLLSGWKYDKLAFYEEPRDSLTNFFIDWLPHGEYILKYRLKPSKPGTYRMGASTLQSMYSPDMTAHSAGFIIKVSK